MVWWVQGRRDTALEGSGEGGTGVSPVNGGTEMTGETPVPLLLLLRNFGA